MAGPAFSDLLGEVFVIIHLVWPEITLPGRYVPHVTPVPSNIWTSVQAYEKNFEAEAQASQQNLAGAVPPPYCILSIGDFSDSAEYGFHDFKRARVQVFYVDSPQNGATQATIDAKLDALLSYIDDHDYKGVAPANFANFQVQEFGRRNSSETNPWNAAVLGVNKGELLGGHIEWSPGWLVNG